MISGIIVKGQWISYKDPRYAELVKGTVLEKQV